MSAKERPSLVQTALDVLRQAAGPLMFDELLAAVHARQPIQSRNPKQTLRNAIANTQLIQNAGGGCYGYLPALVAGNVVRHVLTAEDFQWQRLTLGWEVITALWPAGFEFGKRQDQGPRPFALPNGQAFSAPLEFFGEGGWGLRSPALLQSWLNDMQAQTGDALIFQTAQREGDPCRLVFEPKSARDETQIRPRNRAVADIAYSVCKAARSELMLHELAVRLLARGAYRDPYPPDPLPAVIFGDARFRDAGLSMVELAERWNPYKARLALERQRLLDRLFPPVSEEPSAAEIVRLILQGRSDEVFHALRAAGILRERGGRMHVDYDRLFQLVRQASPEIWKDLLGLGRRIEAGRTRGRRRSAADKPPRVYQFKVALKPQPSLWRRIEIRGDQTLGDFDRIIREVFQHDPLDHLSEFYAGRVWRSEGFGEIEPGGGGPGASLRVGELGLSEGDRLEYVYDFGDDIQHVLTLEKISEPEADVTYPRLMAQNKPRYKYCEACQKRGKKTIATWICIECSDEERREVLVCEACCFSEHEDHYADEVLY